MPLTFAHPAVVLPLNYLSKRRVALTGLIVGSVAPDFEYFIRMKILSIYSHTWLGLLWFDLPLGIILCYVYHNIVRDNFINGLPLPLYKRLAPYKTFNWNGYSKAHFLIVIVSVAIGAASHLFWDSFTHANGYFVMRWDMGRSVQVMGQRLPLYKVVQHISTLAGAVVVLVALFKLPASNIKKQKSSFSYRIGVFLTIVVVLTLRAILSQGAARYPDMIVTTITGLVAGLILTPLILTKNSLVKYNRTENDEAER